MSHSTCQISAQAIAVGTKVVVTVTLMDRYGNRVASTDEILEDFTAGTKLLDFYLHQNVPNLSIALDTGGLTISFVPLIAKTFHLRLGSPSSQMVGSPFLFRAIPGENAQLTRTPTLFQSSL